MRFYVAGLALVAAMIVAPLAAADAPDSITHDVVDFTREAPFCEFPTIVNSQGVFTVKTYLDDDGNLLREVASVQRSYTITYTNPANGRSISTVLGGPVFVDYHPDGSYTQTVQGRERLYIAPGEGPVASQVGRVVYHVDAAGNVTTEFDAGRWDESVYPGLCAYLA